MSKEVKDGQFLAVTSEIPMDIAISELPIPEDIKVGINQAIHDLTEYIENGFSQNIGTNIKSLLDLAANALDSKLEWTELGKKEFESRILSIVRENLNKGINSLLRRAMENVREGRMESLDLVRNDFVRLFEIAKAKDIPIAFDLDSDMKTEGTEVAPQINSLVDIDKKIEKIISENLLVGIVSRIESLGEHLASGSDFGHLHPNTILSQINRMLWFATNKYGFKSTSEAVIASKEKDLISLVGVKEINTSEINLMIDRAIALNLAKGAAQTINNFGLDITRSYQCRTELKDYYKSEAIRLGLYDSSLSTLVEGNKLNPDMWEDAVAEQVKFNLGKEISSLADKYEEKIQDGRMNSSKDPYEYNLETYIELGKKYGVTVDAEKAQAELISKITPENVQAGIDKLLEKAKESIKSSYTMEAEMIARFSVQGVIDFIHIQHMEDQVDISKLIDYLESLGLTIGDSRSKISKSEMTRILRLPPLNS